MEKLEYMEGLVLVNEKNQLEESLERIIVDFRNDENFRLHKGIN